ncbi:MAG TPA: PKD domain-containing protein [Bacteroidales bacterium]|nr:PKD domain-containing protein [Bacteroidales bacterium]
MKKFYILLLALSFFGFFVNQKNSAQTYAPLPFNEQFEGTWVNKDATRDVPSAYWKNTPATTDSSWSRDDDGQNRGAWSGMGGAYSPSGANYSNHSARFRAYIVPKKNKGVLDLYLDCSGYADTKTLTFWYINPSGVDSLKVYFSTDGGTSFGEPIIKLNTNPTNKWTKYSVSLGSTTSATCVLRFVGIGDYGADDLGIDNVSVTTPTTPITLDFFASRHTGMAPVTIQFADSSSIDLTAWEWDINNDGTADASTQGFRYTYTTPGTYSVKFTGTKGSETFSKTKSNYIIVLPQTYASLPFTENFENNWINRDSIADVPSLYFRNQYSTGSNSWRRDDYFYSGGYLPQGAHGTNHSARIHTYSTSRSGYLDLNLNFSTQAGSKTLSFWYINTSGSDSLKVFLSTDGGASFGKGLSVQKVAASWTYVKVELGDVNSATGVVRFVAYGDNGMSDIGLDQIYVESPSASPVKADYYTGTPYGIAPFTMSFKDVSTGAPTNWEWDFDNNGTVDASTQNATHTYSTPGVYSVKFRAYKTGSSETISKNASIFVGGYASLPLFENFEGDWISRAATRDVPSLYVVNSPATDNNSWSRNDDGEKRGAWGSSYGNYTPVGANNTGHSARFHSCSTSAEGNLDYYINFSTLAGSKSLTFWYLSYSERDSLKVYLSTDNGATFNLLDKRGVVDAWTMVTVDLGNVTTATGIVRFKGKGSYGSWDIGLDEISIGTSTPINAEFTADKKTGPIPFTVNFSDQSTGEPTTWAWDFNNDGITDATTQNPSYTFTTIGSYSVKLVTSKPGAIASRIKNQYITTCNKAPLPFTENFENEWVNRGATRDVPSIYAINSPATTDSSWSRSDDGYARGVWSNNYGSYSPEGALNTLHSARFHSYYANTGKSGYLDFYIDFSSLAGNKRLTFQNINAGGSDFLKVYLSVDGGLTFGDALVTESYNYQWTEVSVDLGNITSSNAVLRFKATSDCGNSDIGIDEIRVDVPVDAQFTANKTSGVSPLVVSFTDQSTGTPTTWAWDFNNDGTVDATTQNPSFTYSAAGTYTVKLVASKTGSSDTETKTAYITVSAPVEAAFSANVTSGLAPLQVNFTDQSTGTPTTWAWDFNNDGTVDATTQNPSYTYSAAGTYTVKLVASKTGSSDTETKTAYITVSAPVEAAFTANKTTGSAPLQVNFTDQSTGTPTTWAWDFDNDGTVDATTKNPSFTYTTSGTYTVKLVVSKTGSTDTETKTGYITVSPATGIADNDNQVSAEVYPNPASGKVYIRFAQHMEKEKVKVFLLDSNGRMVKIVETENQDVYELDITGYAPGVYFVKVVGKQELLNKKLIVQ